LERGDETEKIAISAERLYRDVSKNLDVPDYIIVASALEINGMVVTLNKSHFTLIPNLTLYSLNDIVPINLPAGIATLSSHSSLNGLNSNLRGSNSPRRFEFEFLIAQNDVNTGSDPNQNRIFLI